MVEFAVRSQSIPQRSLAEPGLLSHVLICDLSEREVKPTAVLRREDGDVTTNDRGGGLHETRGALSVGTAGMKLLLRVSGPRHRIMLSQRLVVLQDETSCQERVPCASVCNRRPDRAEAEHLILGKIGNSHASDQVESGVVAERSRISLSLKLRLVTEELDHLI